MLDCLMLRVPEEMITFTFKEFKGKFKLQDGFLKKIKQVFLEVYYLSLKALWNFEPVLKVHIFTKLLKAS